MNYSRPKVYANAKLCLKFNAENITYLDEYLTFQKIFGHKNTPTS